MRRWLHEHSLALVMFALFALTLGGQIATGLAENNENREEHDQPPIGLTEYLSTGHFIEAVFENWESEFLQMSAFVVLTIMLRQKGSPESRPLAGRHPTDEDPDPNAPGAPWPVRVGGPLLWVYERSLGLVLFSLFLLSLGLHAIGGAEEFNDEQTQHGSSERVTPVGYLATPRFWFESFQNWQSEFMSVGALVVLSVYLRQKGSPESKPVGAPHAETGD